MWIARESIKIFQEVSKTQSIVRIGLEILTSAAHFECSGLIYKELDCQGMAQVGLCQLSSFRCILLKSKRKEYESNA
jgi:hypothetical protein